MNTLGKIFSTKKKNWTEDLLERKQNMKTEEDRQSRFRSATNNSRFTRLNNTRHRQENLLVRKPKRRIPTRLNGDSTNIVYVNNVPRIRNTLNQYSFLCSLKIR